jgi:addiction module HigA family antidote
LGDCQKAIVIKGVIAVTIHIPTHPGAVLRDDVLPALRMPVLKVAQALGVSRQTLHKILAEKAPVTPGIAVRLGKFCGNGPEIWLALQTQYDLARAKIELADEIKRIPRAKAA